LCSGRKTSCRRGHAECQFTDGADEVIDSRPDGRETFFVAKLGGSELLDMRPELVYARSELLHIFNEPIHTVGENDLGSKKPAEVIFNVGLGVAMA
jgi:hypothetical protein